MSGSAYREGAALGWLPEPDEWIDEWADVHRFLSQKASGEPGRWRTGRTPYLREPMRMLSPLARPWKVVIVGGRQIGKTETGNNFVGYTIHRDPAPILMIQPTLDMAKKVSQQRLGPMIEASPALAALVQEPRSRDSRNRILSKEFPGGVLMLAGANSSAGLRSSPICKLFEDEVDAWPGEIRDEGDPMLIVEKATSNFPRRKVLATSTPTVRDMSRIEREWRRSDQRRYNIPCPACGERDWLQFSPGGRRGDEGIHHHIVYDGRDASSARMKCSRCLAESPEWHKTWMLENGVWVATAVAEDPGIVGYHIPSLLSPLGWRSWKDCVAEFLDAQKDPSKLRVWVNTVLAETYEEGGKTAEASDLKRQGRREVYPAVVPDGVGVLTAGVDTHPDRLEAAVWGWGAGEESWVIATEQVYGDPADPATWARLDELLAQSFARQHGRPMRVECAAIDSGGTHPDAVYRYAAARVGRKVFAVRGGNVAGAPLVARPGVRNRYRIKLFTLGVDAGKDMLASALMVQEPGPGFVHLPDWFDDESIEQLTAERPIRKWVKGRGSVRTWENVRPSRRNEQLDCAVYARAALHILGQTFIRGLAARAARLSAEPTPDAPPDPGAPPPPPAPAPPAAPRRVAFGGAVRRRTWATRW